MSYAFLERKQLPLPEHLNYTTSRHVGLHEDHDSRDDYGTSKTYNKHAPSLNERRLEHGRPSLRTRELTDTLQPMPRIENALDYGRLRIAKERTWRDNLREPLPYQYGAVDDVAMALQEAYAEEILRSAPNAWADAGTQTPGSMYRRKGKTGVTKGAVIRKPQKRTNPRRAAAEADLQEIELRRRYGSVYGVGRKPFNDFQVPRAKDIAQYFLDVNEGRGSEYLDAATAYAMGDLRRSRNDHPSVAASRMRFDNQHFQVAAHLAEGLLRQRDEAEMDRRRFGEHAQVQTSPMRRRSATAVRDRSKAKAKAPKRKATSAEPVVYSWAGTDYATTVSSERSSVSGPDSHFSSAASDVVAEQKKARRKKVQRPRQRPAQNM